MRTPLPIILMVLILDGYSEHVAQCVKENSFLRLLSTYLNAFLSILHDGNTVYFKHFKKSLLPIWSLLRCNGGIENIRKKKNRFK